jgi:MurNAc alpha-1-phosphate uridylyltransferase
MRAMILAAGRGERLRPLTDTTPKALVEAGGTTLLERHLRQLAQAGFRECVINLGHLGSVIRERIGTGDRWNINIQYSDEGDNVLETGGGIARALPLLGDAAFAVVNADIWTDFDYARLRNTKCDYAHLVMVDNPSYNPAGDFNLSSGLVKPAAKSAFTFSGIAAYHPRMFAAATGGKFPLAPLLTQVMETNYVTGEYFAGFWLDTGTEERLNSLRQKLADTGK